MQNHAKKTEIISSWPHHCPHIFYFSYRIIQEGIKMGHGFLVRGTGNWSFITRFSKAVLISQVSALVAGGASRVPIKSLLLVFEKSHNLVFPWVIVTTQQDCTQKMIRQENCERKRGRIKRQIFVKWGRGKREAMANNVNCKEMRFVIRNLVYVEDPPRQRCQKFLLMSLEATSVFPQRGRDDAAQRR